MASDDAALTEEVIRRWHDLVHGLDPTDPGLERLRAVTIYGDRRVVGVVRPNFLTRARYESERLAVARVGAALSKLLASPPGGTGAARATRRWRSSTGPTPR